MLSPATRHFGDIMVGFGLPSQSWNARDQYRTEYSASDRVGAGIGTAAAVAVPAFTLARSFKGEGFIANKFGSSFQKPVVDAMRSVDPAQADALAQSLKRGGLQKNLARAYVAGVGTIGAMKLKDIAQDDGHWGAAGATVGMIGGATAGWHLIGKAMHGKPSAPMAVPLLGTAAAIGAGFIGYQAAKHVSAGNGERQTTHVDPYVTTGGGDNGPGIAGAAKDAAGGLADSGRGFWAHLIEGGPLSPGFTMEKWGQDKAFKENASPEYRNGGLGGDFVGTGIIAAGALTAGAGIVLPSARNGLSDLLTNRLANLTHMGVQGGTQFSGQTAEIATKGVKAGLYAAAALPAVYAIAQSGAVGGFSKWRETGESGDLVAGLGVLGATAGGAALMARVASKSEAFQRMAPGTQIPAGVLTGVLLVSALSGAQKPGKQLYQDFNVAVKDNNIDIARAGINAAPSAVMGSVLGGKMGAKFGAKGATIGAVAGGLIGAGGGTMLSVGQTDTKNTAIGAAVGGVGTLLAVERSAIVAKRGKMGLAAMVAGGALAGAVVSGAFGKK